MKSIKIGEKEYQLIETLFDINDERFNIFKQHLMQVFENLDKPLFAATFSKYVASHNSGNHAEGLIEWFNFKKAIDLKELNYDAYSFCFALLCLEPGENQRDCSDSKQLKKLEEIRSNGLTRGMVEETVENFIKASGTTFGVYIQMLELMKAPLQEEYLKE